MKGDCHFGRSCNSHEKEADVLATGDVETGEDNHISTLIGAREGRSGSGHVRPSIKDTL